MEPALFEKNLSLLKHIHPAIKEMISNADCSSYVTCLTAKGEPNLAKILFDRNMYLHSQEGALDEAVKAVEKAISNNPAVILLYGLGFGYYYEAIKPWLKENPKRYFVVLEDDFAVIHYFLDTERATEMLSDPQVVPKFFQKSENNDWSNFDNEIAWLARAFVPVSYEKMILQVYVDQKYFHAYEVLSHFEHAKILETEEYFEFCYRFMKEVAPNIYSNILRLSDSYAGSHFFGMFQGIPAIVCGAGPSLAKQMPLLQKLGDKALIFAAGSSMNVLTRNGLEPHFGVCMDPRPTQKSRQETNLAFEIPFFYPFRLQHLALSQIHGPHLYLDVGRANATLLDNHFYLNSDPTMQVNMGYTSTHISLDLAHKLGCEPIVFVGLDLAYTGNKRYSDGVFVHPSNKDGKYVQQEIEKLNADLEVESIDGGKVLTQKIWIAEAATYSQYAIKHPIPLFNATEGGMPILNVPNVRLMQVVETKLLHSYDISNLIHVAIHEHPPLKHFHKNILKKIEKWKESLQKGIEYCQFLIKEYASVKEKAKSEKIPPKEEWPITRIERKLRDQYFKDIRLSDDIIIYLERFTGFDSYQLLFLADRLTEREKVEKICEMKIDLYSLLKVISEVNLNMIEKLGRTNQESQRYLKEKIPGTRVLLETPENSKEIYSFKNDEIIIKDPEIEISIKEFFYPQYVEESKKPIPGSSIQPIDRLYCEKEGIWEGQYLFFYPTGELKGECFYLNNELHGPSRYYTKKGRLLAQTWFIQGKRQGKTLQYYFNGKVCSIQRFRDGKRQGKQEYYYPNGVLKTLMSYIDGELDGDVFLFYPNGRQKKESHFLQGKLDGVEFSWNEAGVLISEAKFHNNNPVERSRLWHSNGKMAREVTFNDQSKVISCFEWDEEGNKKEAF